MQELIPYDMETLRVLNASGLGLQARRFAELEFGKGDREWVAAKLREVNERRRAKSGAWAAALMAYFSPR